MYATASARHCHCQSLLCCLALLSLAPFASAEEMDECRTTFFGPSCPSTSARWDVYLSGHAHHFSGTYSKEQIEKLNEKAWGGGLGRTRRNHSGNDESYYVMAIRDSHEHTQWMAGYAYQWIYPVISDNVEAGVGLTALIIKRQDWFEGHPFPAVLPIASIGTQRVKLVASYVPPVTVKGKQKGNVMLLVAKISF
jgi:palmitoyl transferase